MKLYFLLFFVLILNIVTSLPLHKTSTESNVEAKSIQEDENPTIIELYPKNPYSVFTIQFSRRHSKDPQSFLRVRNKIL